jgi:hypothetical protein
MKRFGLIMLLLSGAVVYGAKPALDRDALQGPPPPTPTKQELEAEFPADLGPETVDVSEYPQYLQQSYSFFREACTICHSSARALNSPLITHADWKSYVRKMHLKAQSQLLTDEDAKRIVDFLVYDSHERKVEHKKEFDRQNERLKERFDQIKTYKASQKK